MGVKGGWDLLNPADSMSLVEWSAQNISTGTLHNSGPCIGVDASGWMFAAKYHYGQTKSPAQASLFKCLGCLFHLPVSPIFVFDGPKCPLNKCKKNITKTSDWLTADFKRLLEGFGFPYWDAPGEAEAELALLSNNDRINVVMSEDFDTMVFGAQRVITDESDSKYMIKVYEKGAQFSPNELIMIALLAGGDYDDGIQGCGIQTAVDITLTGIGERLFEALKASTVENYPTIASMWCQDLYAMLDSQGAGRLHSRRHALASHIPLDFPKVSVLIQYIQPLTSQSTGSFTLPAAPVPCPPDIPKLAWLCKELFIWGHLMGIVQNFCDHVFPGLAIRELLQDLHKRRGVMQESDMSLSSSAIISKVCSIHANQRERSDSEIFISLVIPHAVITQITSSIDGVYNTDITQNSLEQWLEKCEARVWLSHVLALHARPNILDDVEHPTSNTAKKHKHQNSCNKEKGRRIEMPGPTLPPQQSKRVDTKVREESEHWRETPAGQRARSVEVINISSDEDERATGKNCRVDVLEMSNLKLSSRNIHYLESGEILELCTDDEGT
ncbi:PIN domain-like protein [Desarmillaria tabescens]|uniref:PIN domain-like protein n=1 Tax=Armillaria tabescens TaxID=1929756 RepID=A0AA39JWB3_ARMTA|nr:PIN domain-like protein [Desarmillaria tabescens]KAK0448995.1 PIN domain-like protein [Desarmillaria tabescens]